MIKNKKDKTIIVKEVERFRLFQREGKMTTVMLNLEINYSDCSSKITYSDGKDFVLNSFYYNSEKVKGYLLLAMDAVDLFDKKLKEYEDDNRQSN